MNDDLKDLFADLVTDCRWAPVAMRMLFSRPPGTWVSVPSLCEGLPDAKERYRSLMEVGAGDLAATWLAHPNDAEHSFLVLCYHNDEMASSVAIVTDAYLRESGPAKVSESTKLQPAMKL